MKKNLILIKLGGSLITDKSRPFTAREAVIARLGKEVKSALILLKNADLVIAHGSGSFGHTVAAKYQTQAGITNSRSIKGFSLVADAAIQINRIVMIEFLKLGLPVVSFAPLSFNYNAGLAFQFIRPVAKALEIGLIPVVYGDVIMDEKRGFCIFSGEKILNLVAGHFIGKYQNIRIIEAGDTDGVYDASGKTVPIITPKSFKSFASAISSSKSTDVTGGMLHKVREAVDLAAKCNIETTIINGKKKGNLSGALLGKKIVGTKAKAN